MRGCTRLWRARCLPCLRRALGLPLVASALLLVFLLFALLGWFLWWPILKVSPLIVVLYVLTSRRTVGNFMCLFIEHAYSLPLGKLHVTFSSRRNECPFHSRFVDFRVDVDLEHGARASVHLIPLLSDNYAYLVVDASAPAPRPACLVDPCDARAVLDALPALERAHYGGEELDLQAILTTHRHWDHQGGNRELPRLLPSIRRVYGSRLDRVLGCTHEVGHGDEIRVGALAWRVLALPGHTRGCVAYRLCGLSGRDCLMTGDALFCGGRCGAPFEQCEMEEHRNLLTIRRECSDETLLFPGHEYTCRCLGWSQEATLAVFQRSARSSPGKLLAVTSAWLTAIHRRAQRNPAERIPTVPISLGEERLLGSHLWEQLGLHARAVAALLEARAGGGEEDDDGEPHFQDAPAEAEAEDAPPAPVVLRHEHLPRVHGLVALYRSDFDQICRQLEAGELSGPDAAEALRRARGRPDEELHGDPPRRPRGASMISKEKLCQALRVLGVPPDVSIGREAPDLMGLTVHIDHLRSSLQILCGARSSAEALKVLDTLHDAGAPMHSATVVELAAWLSEVPPRPRRTPARGPRRRTRRPPPPPQPAAGCRRLLAPCRAAGRLLCHRRRRVPVEELLLPPRHDVWRCALCASTLLGAASPVGGEDVPRRPQPGGREPDGHFVHLPDWQDQNTTEEVGAASHSPGSGAGAQGRSDMAAPLLPLGA